MMSTPFCNVSTCKRFSLRLALAFCFLSLGSSAAPVDDIAADTADIATHQLHIDSTTAAIESYVQGVSALQAQDSSQWNTFRQHLESYLNNTGPAGSVGKELDRLSIMLRQFLSGSTSDSWYTDFPQFRFLIHSSTRRPQPTDSLVQQSLSYFLTYTLGQNVDFNGSASVRVRDWENFFTTNSVWRSTTSSAADDYYGYSLFNIWLAEALRRQINNTTNLVTADWRALNGSTNPVQAVQASMDQSEQERSISNEVASVESDLNDLFTVDEPDNPSGYDNTDDFSDVVSSLGDDDDSLEWGDTIQLASSSKIRSIASEVGVNYTGPSAEISLSSFAGGVLRTDLIAPVGSLMVSVWHWIRSLAIFWVVVGWYNRVRALLLMSNPEPSTSGPFRDAGGIW